MQPDEISPPQQPMRIVLVGFMGAGKSTVGALLADRLSWKFIDADSYVEGKTGSTIARIFTDFGESAFRDMEAEAVTELHREERMVLALGGGAIESEATRSLLEKSPETLVVFLKAPFEMLIERCEAQPGAAERPVLQQRETLAARFHSRLRHYERAHLTVETAGRTPHEVADRIIQVIPQLYPQCQ